jgi:hypothetical protein
MKEPLTKVIFRAFKRDGEVIALFPEIPADCIGFHCESYMHTGQHGGAYPGVITGTRLATPDEKAPLMRELESIGYRLEERKRISYAMDRARMDAARA